MSPGAALPPDQEVSQEAFLESDPPHWAARGLTYILISLFVALLLISIIVDVPETVSAPFVLVRASGTHPGEAAGDDGNDLHAEVLVPQSALARVSPGQSVKMLYDAFPYQRYGVRYGTVRSATPVSVGGDDRSEFVVIADPAEPAVVVDGRARPLLVGMRGTARIMIGSRSLIGHAFEPLRMLRETVAKPPPAPGPSVESDPHHAG